MTNTIKELKFDEKTMMLGTLCSRKHEWENTGKSLRYKHHRNYCVQCKRLESRNHRRNILLNDKPKASNFYGDIAGLCPEYKDLLKRIINRNYEERIAK